LEETSYPVTLELLPAPESRHPDHPATVWRLVIDTTRSRTADLTEGNISNDESRISTVRFKYNIIPDVEIALSEIPEVQRALEEYVAEGGNPQTLRLFIDEIYTNEDDEEASLDVAFGSKRRHGKRRCIKVHRVGDSFISDKSQELGEAKVYIEFGGKRRPYRHSYDLCGDPSDYAAVKMRLQVKPVERIVTRTHPASSVYGWMRDARNYFNV
jgi:hypothetical protein